MGGAGAVGADGTIIMVAGLGRMKPHVLIVEDSFILAAHLQEVLEDDLAAESVLPLRYPGQWELLPII